MWRRRVVYRKGELSKAGVDRGWPHQVALPSSQVVAEFKTIMEFAEGLSMCVRATIRPRGLVWD
jgi:hypothetical protein